MVLDGIGRPEMIKWCQGHTHTNGITYWIYYVYSSSKNSDTPDGAPFPIGDVVRFELITHRSARPEPA